VVLGKRPGLIKNQYHHHHYYGYTIIKQSTHTKRSRPQKHAKGHERNEGVVPYIVVDRMIDSDIIIIMMDDYYFGVSTNFARKQSIACFMIF